jgi:hypothetical protein
MNKMKIKLTNSFHKTAVLITLRSPFMSEGQRQKSWKQLCGNRGCQCSPMTGMHGEQPLGTTVLSQEYDALGRLTPRFLFKG